MVNLKVSTEFIDTLDGSLLPSLLSAGKVGVLPTDTVYGLVCSASLPAAVEKLFSIKNRPNKPGTVIAANTEQLAKLGLNERDLAQAIHLWPGPVSVILPAPKKIEYLTRGVHGLAARIPSDKKLKALLEQTGPLLTTSANQPGEPPATNLQLAEDYFSDQVDFYVNGGDLSGRQPSKLVKLAAGQLQIVRE